ncbi:MAG: hypothetical protein L0220_19700 [Acidobacteria bacterium]|nr:hypothetical protein [Acidobacteriota bacterium]
MEKHNPHFITNIANQVISVQLGEKFRLSAEKVFSTWGSIVIRCRLMGGSADLPKTLIVKKVREDNIGYDPDSPATPNSAHWIFNDWAATKFLSEIPGDSPLGPLFYGGSREHGLIVLEDLGDGDGAHTAEALGGNDPVLAEQLLIEHAALIGQLHGATMGRFEQYRQLRSTLGPQPIPQKIYQDPWSEARIQSIPRSEIDEAIRAYHANFAAVGIRPQPGVDEEIELVTAAVEEHPGPLLAYCKGDQNGAGDYIRQGGKPKLFDFGVGGFRHALIEGMPWRMTWGCLMRIPKQSWPAMERAYRARLACGYGDAVEDARFYRSLAEAGARWNIFHINHRLPEAVKNDRQRGPTTLRQQVIAWIEAFAQLSEEHGQMQVLGRSAREMWKRLHALWPAESCRLPYYPAFRDPIG